ncbi:Nucleophile aminohydrolase, N-terminal [Trema orientale]|uniref:Nucleophile aminohydrolase, N-terminal n=1 Tax=Trema orientale TaxID=63057 RepID=A0A2P5EID5_TREOI|nr:Nucleophile aminohydrolase, N-terminal [Trema orientale]
MKRFRSILAIAGRDFYVIAADFDPHYELEHDKIMSSTALLHMLTNTLYLKQRFVHHSYHIFGSFDEKGYPSVYICDPLNFHQKVAYGAKGSGATHILAVLNLYLRSAVLLPLPTAQHPIPTPVPQYPIPAPVEQHPIPEEDAAIGPFTVGSDGVTTTLTLMAAIRLVQVAFAATFQGDIRTRDTIQIFVVTQGWIHSQAL